MQKTIKLGPVVSGTNYRHLVEGPGESWLPRTDITLKEPNPSRASTRRSLAYFGHFSDIHIVDAQSPGRLEPLIAVSASFIDASRPHDTQTVQVLAQMIESVANAKFSPLTGMPMTAIVNTGDSADSRNSLELDWCIDIFDGKSVVPDSGQQGVYAGVQLWNDVHYVWQPGDPSTSKYGPYGFPTLPALLDKAVSMTVKSKGSPVPYYVTYGNHDALFMGNIRVEPSLQTWAMGNKKASSPQAATRNMLAEFSNDTSVFNQFSNALVDLSPLAQGIHTVTANSARKLFTAVEFMQAHLDSPPIPGPVGHGFTQENVDQVKTYWKADATPYLTMFALDTCNQVTGADGAVPQDQFDWLEAGLKECQQKNKLAIVLSHHNTYTLENVAEPAFGPSQNLIHADEFVQMLQQYPNMVAWVNGHTHTNTINAHPKEGGGGFWEITTASCVDYPQQQQLVEFVDNRDGTMSIFATCLDHTSPAAWDTNDYSQKGLASLSRQLAANSWEFDPLVKPGSEYDRNVELLLPAPFDLSKITEAMVDQVQAISQAQIMAQEKQQQSGAQQ